MVVVKGWSAEIYIDGGKVGQAQEINVDVDTSVEFYHTANDKIPARLLDGPIKIQGTMKRAWVDSNYLSLITGTFEMSYFDLTLKVKNPSSGADLTTLYVYDCKFSKGSVKVPQDGFLTSDMSFVALKASFA